MISPLSLERTTDAGPSVMRAYNTSLATCTDTPRAQPQLKRLLTRESACACPTGNVSCHRGEDPVLNTTTNSGTYYHAIGSQQFITE